MNNNRNISPEDISWLYVNQDGHLYVDSTTIDEDKKVVVMNRVIGFKRLEKTLHGDKLVYLYDVSKKKGWK